MNSRCMQIGLGCERKKYNQLATPQLPAEREREEEEEEEKTAPRFEMKASNPDNANILKTFASGWRPVGAQANHNALGSCKQMRHPPCPSSRPPQTPVQPRNSLKILKLIFPRLFFCFFFLILFFEIQRSQIARGGRQPGEWVPPGHGGGQARTMPAPC